MMREDIFLQVEGELLRQIRRSLQSRLKGT
jgi:hypothetical protein